MLFTRTIRRTLVCGLAMVLVMMISLSLSALYSHVSHRHIIEELNFAFNEIPRKSELVEAIVRLEGPLLTSIREKPEALRLWKADFRKALDDAKTEADTFLLKMEHLPPSSEFMQARLNGLPGAATIRAKLAEIDRRFDAIDDAANHEAARLGIKHDVDRLEQQAQQIPDFPRGITETFREARAVFRRGFWLVVSSAVIAVVLFTWLIVYGYVWVFSPLRKLHQGARRVAQGDFNYRLELSRQDEMQELADAFNSMTTRFQEIACDLDRQVCERIRQLIRSERLAGIGFLAAGVAHEINNPLSAIAMASESLNDRMTNPVDGSEAENAEVARQYLQMIQREAFRCQRITQKLLDFARGNGDARSRYDLTALVNDVLGVIRHMNRYGDRTIRFNRSTPCEIEINGPEIQQVIMNLVSNGIEAMDGGGTMTIDITDQPDHVTLTVTDNGCGMSPDVIENLFEPFFTQRRHGRRTGLGLSISHRIVSDHGGAIEVESGGPGLGSTFRVRLPRRAVVGKAAA